jgi:hypothetical protein
MNIVVPAIVGLVLLAGLVTLALGHKGWNLGTVAAAILTLLASGGYVYLAARIAERERAWTKVVRKYEADVIRARDAETVTADGRRQPIPGEKSLAALADEEARWRRVLERVETWRGRTWKRSSFAPPQGDAPGTITLPEQEVAAAEPAPAAEPAEGGPADAPPVAPVAAPVVPITAGAEVSVFDDAPLEEGGRFLGIFRVVAATFDAAAKRTTLQVVPATPPDQRDRGAWSKTYDAVTVFEDPPVDRWMAFHRMPQRMDGDALPDPAKAPPERLLDQLERLEADLERHGTEVEGEPAEIAARLAADQVTPGRYWAVVEFTAARDLEPAVVKRITDLLAPDFDDAMVRKSFEPGDVAEFDLQSALALGGDVKIVKVFDRRPLTDAFTSLRGGTIAGGADNPLKADGMAALRRGLEAEMAALERATMRLETARGDVQKQHEGFDAERQALRDDLGRWLTDVTAAERTAAAFENRLQRIQGELTAAEQAIGALGAELTAGIGRLTATIDGQTPPPRGGAVPPAGRTR